MISPRSRVWLYDLKMRVLGWLHICQCCQRARAKWVDETGMTGWLCASCYEDIQDEGYHAQGDYGEDPLGGSW
jgi:hypothetical protein